MSFPWQEKTPAETGDVPVRRRKNSDPFEYITKAKLEALLEANQAVKVYQEALEHSGACYQLMLEAMAKAESTQ